MPQFPSAEWFEQVREIFNGDESYQEAGGGMCDATMGIKVAENAYIVVFEGDECSEVREVPEPDLAEADFYLEMAAEEWQDMIRTSRREAVPTWTTRSQTLDHGRSRPRAHNEAAPVPQDPSNRFNQTFQYFFDASARIDTEFTPDAG